MKSTRGLGLTVKCRNRLTTSLSVKMLDWAGPYETMQENKSGHQLKSLSVCVCVCTHLITCSKLLNCHKREANECEGFAEDFALVLWCGL